MTTDDDVCSICRESMEQSLRLECSHQFHQRCIDIWRSHGGVSCPICRHPFPLDETDEIEIEVDVTIPMMQSLIQYYVSVFCLITGWTICASMVIGWFLHARTFDLLIMTILCYTIMYITACIKVVSSPDFGFDEFR